MKKLILSFLGLFCAATTCLHAQTTIGYKPLSQFNRDTVAYLKYNFEQNKARYIGQSFKKIISDYGLPIKRYRILLEGGMANRAYLNMILISYRPEYGGAYVVHIWFDKKRYYVSDNPEYVQVDEFIMTDRTDALEAFSLLPDYIVSDITVAATGGNISTQQRIDLSSPVPLFTLSAAGDITVKPEFITPLPNTGTVTKMHGTGNINLASKNYKINIGLLQGYFSNHQSSGFNVMEFDNGSQTVLTLKQPVIWNYIKSTTTAHDFSAYGNNYFIRMDISANAQALVFVGWPYYGHLPQVTIVAATQKEIKVVYNREAELKTADKKGGNVTELTLTEYNRDATSTERTIRINTGTLYIQ